ncbi:fructosamine kinase family protein [Salsuginibacillus halophilus]|nr:fructosamine kinase family protein [Salsuginibacillus halophilus]
MNLEKALTAVGAPGEDAQKARPVGGGSICQSFYVPGRENAYFVKLLKNAPVHFFDKEASGLKFLAAAEALTVPEVYGVGEEYIVLEWVEEGRQNAAVEEELGRGIASLHAVTADDFGLAEDNFIGELPQENTFDNDWVDFYREQRLYKQFELARSIGRLGGDRAARAWQLLDQLDDFLPRKTAASKLHGDLWSGNWMAASNGRPYIIDPAVYYGHREVELAFMELFGGFSPRVFAAYQEQMPLEAAFEERKPLYQLYYLLVHLNIFGESYGADVDRILRRYTK